MILSAFEEFSYWKQKVIDTSGLRKMQNIVRQKPSRLFSCYCIGKQAALTFKPFGGVGGRSAGGCRAISGWKPAAIAVTPLIALTCRKKCLLGLLQLE
jgi:hypothetical protein